MSPRVIQIPLSGGDRKHYAKQLRIAETRHSRLLQDLTTARRTADLLECEEWSVRQFIGGDLEPSPSIAGAVEAGCVLLNVECRGCGHADRVDLTEVIWPREKPIHTLQKKLICQSCGKRGPNLVGLEMRNPDMPPAAARRR